MLITPPAASVLLKHAYHEAKWTNYNAAQQ